MNKSVKFYERLADLWKFVTVNKRLPKGNKKKCCQYELSLYYWMMNNRTEPDIRNIDNFLILIGLNKTVLKTRTKVISDLWEFVKKNNRLPSKESDGYELELHIWMRDFKSCLDVIEIKNYVLKTDESDSSENVLVVKDPVEVEDAKLSEVRLAGLKLLEYEKKRKESMKLR